MTNQTDAVTVSAPAKLNLGLRVLRRRADGYHDILTTFLAVDWTDRLTVALAARESSTGPGSESGGPADSMTCSDPAIPTDESNLCLRAVHALRQWAAVHRRSAPLAPLHVDLEKRIPAGAGLGGGSSDAAATLRAAAQLWDLHVPDDDLRAIAADLGADVPFFLDPTPPRLATGIGDRLRRLTARPGLPMEHILIAVPDIHVSTADAYAGVTPSPPDNSADEHSVPESDGKRLAAAFVSTDPAVWRRDLVNDFEASVFERYPEVARIKQQMYADDALYASMSGSGSAVFGIFRTEDAVRKAEQRPGRNVRVRWLNGA